MTLVSWPQGQANYSRSAREGPHVSAARTSRGTVCHRGRAQCGGTVSDRSAPVGARLDGVDLRDWAQRSRLEVFLRFINSSTVLLSETAVSPALPEKDVASGYP